MEELQGTQEPNGEIIPTQEAVMTEADTATAPAPATSPEGVRATIDMLRDIISVQELDPSLLPETPTTFATAVRVVPQSFQKVRLECHISRYPKDSSRTDRILDLFDAARRFDKNVCLCPSGKEPHPVLHGPNEIRRSRIYRYFQDKPGAQKSKYANSLYGFVVFGVTVDVDDFVVAMKDWATSNRHELFRHGVPSTSVIAGFLTLASVTLNREDCISAIKKTQEWTNAGQPDFSMKVAMLWSSGGAEAKVHAICLECDKAKVQEFVKMCESLFFGENMALPTSLRQVFFFPSRSFSATSPTRLTYITGQRDYLASDRTVTCEGLGDIYQLVHLRTEPTVTASVEDIIMSLTGVHGPLFRSLEKTIDNKVFLKLDASNLSAWSIRKEELANHIRKWVHPEDHALIFRNEYKVLNFSEPWQKFKDGQLTRNVIDLPCIASLEYVDRCQAKLVPLSTPQGPKKRAYSNVSEGTRTTESSRSATTFSTMSGEATNAIDLTTDDRKPSFSPSHKVHVVEQRTPAASSSVTSFAETISPMTSATSPRTARMQHLEKKVEAHDKKLSDIQTSVSHLDVKIDKGHASTNFQFGKLEEMLAHIHGEIVAGVQSSKQEAERLSVLEHVTMSEWEDDGGAHNPVVQSRDWNEVWRQDKAHRSFIESQRVEYVEELRKEAEQKGQRYDYYAVACERFPSPPPIDYPDDITYIDDL